MIFKVPFNQIFSHFNTMLYPIKYRSSLIMVYFTFTVHKLVYCIVLKFEKIWLSRTLNITQKPRKSLFSKRKRNITYELYLSMIFKIPLNHIFSNFNTMLYTIKYRSCLIMVYFPFTVHKIWPRYMAISP
jgi:hypothetical protein